MGRLKSREAGSPAGALESICTSDTASGGVQQTRDARIERLLEPAPRDKATLSLAAKIALRGGQISLTEFGAPWTPWCDTPVPIRRRVRGSSRQHSVEVAALAPCRKCQRCLTFRRLQWRERMLREIYLTAQANRRSWFVTLTFDPPHLAGVMQEARRRRDGSVENASWTHVARYFKRLRKGGVPEHIVRAFREGKINELPPPFPKERFRYCAIHERGDETGRTHWHLLVHESGPRPIGNRHLKAVWRSNVDAVLVDAADRGLAAYLTTYLNKGSGRPRASLHYGR